MRYVVYCILRATGSRLSRLPPGAIGANVTLLTEGKLAAAVSRVPDSAVAINVARVTAYAGVIAALAARRTVLPMRYGCAFASTAQVREFLRARRPQLTLLLERLDGCVEMGIRALPAVRDHPVPTAKPCSGTSYLAARRATFAIQDAECEAGTTLAAALRRAFRKLTVESRAVTAPQLSLAFLIRRPQVAAFCQTFQRIQERYTQSLLLSGPWAPYNFVGDL